MFLILTSEFMMAASCDATLWWEYAGTRLWKFAETNANFYVAQRIAIDADGAPMHRISMTRGLIRWPMQASPVGRGKTF